MDAVTLLSLQPKIQSNNNIYIPTYNAYIIVIIIIIMTIHYTDDILNSKVH